MGSTHDLIMEIDGTIDRMKFSTHDWLLFDADDTLWQNNQFFEDVIETFIDFVADPKRNRDEVRNVLDRIEIRNSKVSGFGIDNFRLNLIDCYQHLRGRSITVAELQYLRELTGTILSQSFQPLPGVAETLMELSRRYRIGLVTKGIADEQHSKLNKSGLRDWFTYVVVAKQKDVACYEEIVRNLDTQPDRVSMIGNSPKSDVNPALQAGLGAVLIPHPQTWRLELEPIVVVNERFRCVDRFIKLMTIF